MRRALLAAALCALLPAAARAAPSCSSLGASLTFGPAGYNVYNTTDMTQAGTLSYKCPPPTAPVVSMSASANGAYGPRQMTSGGNTLNYELYFDAAMTIVWGIGADSHPLPAAGGISTVPFYGRIFAQQDAAVGTYSDTITVTFNF
jgi:spore coat protein U-like protein